MIELIDEWSGIDLFCVVIKPNAEAEFVWQQLYAQMMGWA